MYSKDDLMRLEQPDLVKLIDDGRLVYLPDIKPEQILYTIVPEIDYGFTKDAPRIELIDFFGFTIKDGVVNITDCPYDFSIGITAYDIGKTVFLSREEAEAKLK